MAFKASATVVLLVALVLVLVSEPHLVDSHDSSGGSNNGEKTPPSPSGEGPGKQGGQPGGGRGGQPGGGHGGQPGGGHGGQPGGGHGGQPGGGHGGQPGGSHGGQPGGGHGGQPGGGHGGPGGSHGGQPGGSHGGQPGGGHGGQPGGGHGGQHGGGHGGQPGGHHGGWGGDHHGGGGRGGGGRGGGPNCGKNGAMCGDPKIIGGDGVMFYFHGRKDQHFCLVSDSDLHINAHFIGLRPLDRFRDFTWVQALTFISNPHKLTIAARKVATWSSDVDQLELTYNGQLIQLNHSWTSPDPSHSLQITRTASTNALHLVVREKMGVELTVVPVGAEENRVHNYGITSEDCFAHFDMQFQFWNLSTTVDGVLGQTYQPGFVNPVKRGVAMPIMGGVDRFRSSTMEAADCPRSQYTGVPIAEGSAMASFTASCGGGGLPNGVPGGMICRR